jgi:hypothetical protein
MSSAGLGVLDVKQQHQRDGKLACHEAMQEIINDFFVQTYARCEVGSAAARL